MNIKIMKIRKENEKGEIICIREINDNIKRVFNKKPLTRPLRTLNKNCDFSKKYNALGDLKSGVDVKARQKEYRDRPEIKAKQKEYHKEWYQKQRKNENQIPKN